MFKPAYNGYVLSVLTLVYTLNYLDRGLMTLLLQPIKDDLHLSDTQLGFLTGIVFGLFYAVCGLPIARWADRGNRVTITAMAIGLWGVTVMLCLFVRNFFQLILARTAAGIGEAGCMPPSYSLVGDYFHSAPSRSRAMGVYWLASPLSSLISFLLGGWLNARYGWRLTFFIVGLPALAVAVLVKLTVREPREMRGSSPGFSGQPPPRMREVLQLLWHQPSTRYLCLGLILLYTMWLGLSPWYGAFMMRSHGMSTQELSVWFGVILGVGGVIGVLGGGYVSAGLFANNERSQVRLSAVTAASTVPFFLLFLLLPAKPYALAALVPLVIASNFIFGPIFALLQRLVPDGMRATMLALVMLLANLIGMGIGPQMVGVLSDWLAPILEAESLRYSMLTMASIGIVGAWFIWRVGRTVEHDLTQVASARIVGGFEDHASIPSERV